MMKPSKTFYIIITALFLAFYTTAGFSKEHEQAPGYLGVRLMPVPEMLRVHLGLDEGAGQLIINVVAGSPADDAGLQQYDVITGIDGDEVREYGEFVEVIQSAGAGTQITLTFISGGKKQNAEVRLEKAPEGQPDWKYDRTPLGLTPDNQPGPYGKKFYWNNPFDDETPDIHLPDRFKRFFKKEFRFWDDPNEGGITIIPDEQTYRLDSLEQRLDELESRQERILEILEELREKGQ